MIYNFILFFSPDNRLWHFMQIVSPLDNVKAYFLEKKNNEKIFQIRLLGVLHRWLRVKANAFRIPPTPRTQEHQLFST